MVGVWVARVIYMHEESRKVATTGCVKNFKPSGKKLLPACVENLFLLKWEILGISPRLMIYGCGFVTVWVLRWGGLGDWKSQRFLNTLLTWGCSRYCHCSGNHPSPLYWSCTTASVRTDDDRVAVTTTTLAWQKKIQLQYRGLQGDLEFQLEFCQSAETKTDNKLLGERTFWT